MFSRLGIFGKVLLVLSIALFLFILIIGIILGVGNARETKTLIKGAREYIGITGNDELKDAYEKIGNEQKKELLYNVDNYLIKNTDNNLGMEDEINLNKLGTYDKIIYLIVDNNTKQKEDIENEIEKYKGQETGIELQVINRNNEDEIATFDTYYKELNGERDLNKLTGLYIKNGKIIKEYSNVSDLGNLPVI